MYRRLLKNPLCLRGDRDGQYPDFISPEQCCARHPVCVVLSFMSSFYAQLYFSGVGADLIRDPQLQTAPAETVLYIQLYLVGVGADLVRDPRLQSAPAEAVLYLQLYLAV